MADQRRGRKSDYRNGKWQEWQAGDEIDGMWSRERYLQMDADFCSRLERAIARGEERRPTEAMSDRCLPPENGPQRLITACRASAISGCKQS